MVIRVSPSSVITLQGHCSEAGPKSRKKVSRIRVESRLTEPGSRSDCYTTTVLIRLGMSVRASGEKDFPREERADPHFYLSSQHLIAAALTQPWTQSTKLREEDVCSQP